MYDHAIGSSQLTTQQAFYDQRFAQLEERVKQIEKLVHYPAATKMKEQAAQAEATQNLYAPFPAKEIDTAVALEKNLYAPLRNDTKAVLDLAAFARRLLDPYDLGHAVTFEVRNAARRALGLPEAKITTWPESEGPK